MEPNFSGYVTKANLRCTDGRIIMPNAFLHQDGEEVPLVYQHNHDDIDQVLGRVRLSARDDGIWGDVFLNETAAGKTANQLVQHGDIRKFSVWAKNLRETGDHVHHGDIQEVSLVLSAANPGANIQNVLMHNIMMHSGLDEDEFTQWTVEIEMKHSDADDKVVDKPEDEAGDKPETKTVEDVLNTLNDEQRAAVNQSIDDIVTEAVTEALTNENLVLEHGDTHPQTAKGTKMTHRNAFDRSKQARQDNQLPELKHSDARNLLLAYKGNPTDIRGFNDQAAGGSLREFIRSSRGQELLHAGDYGIDNIEVLFPDAQALMQRPVFVDRRQDWVKKFMAGVSKSPFSRVKTFYADITADEARARGYIKGNQKVEEVFPVFKRTTGPTMVYKKQKLDRQDIIDIVDFDVVAWMKAEMRGKLDEELARAALLGDGRPAMIGGDINPDKIAEPTGTSGDGIRSILNDHDLYTVTYTVPMPASPTFADYNRVIDRVTEAREDYMGSGSITGFMTYRKATKLLTMRDMLGHRIYKNYAELANDMGFKEIVPVPSELFPSDVWIIALDLSDYNFGANKGGEVTLFEDFDIDVNQHKYLIETYVSGAQVMPYCAQVFREVASASNTLVTPTMLSFTNPDTIEYVAQTGVVYKRTDTGATLAADVTLVEGQSVTVEAFPAAGYYFDTNLDRHDSRTYTYGDATGVPEV